MRINQKFLRVSTAILLAGTLLTAQATPQTGYFIYDEAGHLIGEYDSNGNVIQEHIYLGDRPVAVVQGQTGSVGYVTADQLNTPRAVTDQNAALEWSWTSDPFGNGQPTGSLTYNLRFPGQYYDAETGHNYNYNRDYDSATGRYVEPDPIGVSGLIKRSEDLSRAKWLFATDDRLTNPQLVEFPNLNIYSYTGQNPLNATDKKGENLVVVVAAVAVVAAAYALSFYLEAECQSKVCANPKMCPYKRDNETDEGKADAWIYQCKTQCAKGVTDAIKILSEAN